MDGALKYRREIDPVGDTSVAKLLRWIRPGSKVLEMGPATGMMTSLLKSEKGCDVVCVEIDPQAAQEASPYCSKMIVSDLHDSAWEGSLQEERFDYITFADVLEHLRDPLGVLKRSLGFLKPGGEVLISVPNIGYVGIIAELLEGRFDYRRDGLLDETHLHFFTRASLQRLLQQAGLSGLEWSRTSKAPEFSEFKLQTNLLGAHVRSVLACVPDGDTYQFLARASREGVAEPAVFPQSEAFKNSHLLCQIFPDLGEGFKEDTSIAIPLDDVPARQSINIKLPAGLRAVRIDPIDAQFPIELHEIRIAAANKDLRTWTPEHGALGENFGIVNAEELAIGKTSLFLPTNNDSAILISVDCCPTESELTINLSLRIGPALADLKEYLRLQSEDSSLKRAQIKDLEEYQEVLSKNLRAATEENQQLDRQRVEVHSKNASLELQRDSLAKEIADLTAIQISADEKIEQLKTFAAFAEQQVASHREMLERITTSRSWKLTRPLRELVEVVKLARRHLLSFVRHFAKFLFSRFYFLGRSQVGGRVWRRLRLGTDYDLRRLDADPSEQQLEQWVRMAQKWPQRPKFSIVMPTYKTKPRWLKDAIESVRRQIYPEWELCIADDASNDPGVRSILSTYAANDCRIKVVFLEQNGHISRASNAALDLATGEYAVLLDHDDLLAPHALYKVAEAIVADASIDVVYSDEDKIREGGDRFEPTCKPAWSPDYFLSFMYTGHISCFRSSLVRAVGGFREGFEGSQDYDLMLRVTERTEKILHLPEVLYHWRSHEQSVAGNLDSKPYAFEAAKRAIREALVRRGFSNASVGDSRIRGLYLVDRGQQACLKTLFALSDQAKPPVLGGGPVEVVKCDEEADLLQMILSFKGLDDQVLALSCGSADHLESLYRLLGQASDKKIGVIAPLLADENGLVVSAGLSIVSGRPSSNFRGLQVSEVGYRGRLAIPFNVSIVLPHLVIFRSELLANLPSNIASLSDLISCVCLAARSRNMRCVLDPSVVVTVSNADLSNALLSQRRFQRFARFYGFTALRDPYLPSGLSKYVGSKEMPAV